MAYTPLHRSFHLFLFSSSNILSTKSLCIRPGKFVWVLYVDATCINYNGNVFDATLLAMVAALKNGSYSHRRNYGSTHYNTSPVSLPKATYHEETNHVTCSRKTREPLSLQGTPISSSFGVFDSCVFLTRPIGIGIESLHAAHNCWPIQLRLKSRCLRRR